MQPRFTIRSSLAFFVLLLCIQELHELAHHMTGYLCCGCFGKRDFLYWSLCTDCNNESAFAITAVAGPTINYVFMWMGFFLMDKRQPATIKSLGFVFVMATLPLPRLFAVANRGGDETDVIRQLIGNGFHGLAVVSSIILVSVLILPVLWRAFQVIKSKHKIIVVTAFLLLPWLLNYWLVVQGLNKLISMTNTMVVAGMSWQLVVWEIGLLTALILLRKSLAQKHHEPLTNTD